MNGFGTILDSNVILEITRGATREQALEVRNSIRMLLRAVEDIHGLPKSVPTKADLERERVNMERLDARYGKK